jgi:hypothetical protein
MIKKHKKNLEKEIIFWALVGPFMILLLFWTSLIRAGYPYTHLVLPALFAIPLCWKWKMKGFVSALCFLIFALALSYSSIPIEDRFWQIGMVLALTLSFVAMTLSFEEVEKITEEIHCESNSRLENLWRLDEKLKSAQELWHTERSQLIERVQNLDEKHREEQHRSKMWEKAVAHSRRDIETLENSEERLLEELFEKRSAIIALKQRAD